MELHNLTPAKGSIKKKKRIARGQGSGHGGTSTRGHKGAKSRSGYSRKRNFEGGQMPLQMRLPKRGFKNPNRVEYVAVNLSRLQEMHDKHGMKDVSVDALYQNRFIKKNDRVKVLGNGELSAAINVTVHAISESAKSKIESKGGTVTIL
jgi:large subunit ribosomal protein L15